MSDSENTSDLAGSEATAEPETTSAQEPSKAPTYVVGIGASAGGLEALVQFFSVMPTNSGFAFVVVQHLSPDFKSVMDELLSRHSSMPFHQVKDRVEIDANTVYLIPPKMEMVLLDGRLLLADKDPKTLSLPIDVFFRSLAQDRGERAIAVVLSGTGSDGSRGIIDIHDAGGLVIAQSEGSAKFNGMPRSATETGLVDYVLSPEEIPSAILKYTGSFLISGEASEQDNVGLPSLTDQYLAIFKRLRSAFKTDFTYYKPTTVNRRIERRMAVHQLETLEEYIRKLDEDPKEVRLLYHDLLIGVTRFFRDPEAFSFLEQETIAKLVEEKQDGDQIRVWVPACATGEEAYSIAMLFMEAISRSGKRLDVKIFGTDLHRDSINFAANGVYPAENLELVEDERIERFFKPNDSDYQIAVDVRKMIVFAEHNLLKDPPFTNIDLVSCRNFLIYLQPIAQKKVLTMFLFSLNVGGTLFLGPSESLGDMENEFDIIERQWNFFRKRKDVRLSPLLDLPPLGSVSHSAPVQGVMSDGTFIGSRRSAADRELTQAYDELLAHHMPPSLLLDASNQLTHVFGDGSEYISTPKGRSSLDVLSMVEGNLRLALSTAIQRARKENAAFSLSNVPVDIRGQEEPRFVDLTARPMRDARFLIIHFEEHRTPKRRPESEDSSEDSKDFDVGAETRDRIFELEKELQFSRENLQATIEELETSNEELQATNEELLASNEELQSTNEELQSVNEELFTVNTEYEKKNAELTQLNTDIDNLLQSTEIGTVFIDDTLRIRKFTPAIAETFNLLPMDIGRPFEHITFSLIGNENIVDQVRDVVETKHPMVKEVRDRSGRWKLLRIFPYLNSREEASGAVLTVVDITPIKSAEQELERRTESLAIAKNDLEQFAFSVSHDLQEPLRTISGYVDLLKKRLVDLDEESSEYFDYVRGGALKLKDQINGLLTYTRVETRAQPPEEMSLSSILDQVERLKKDEIEASGTEIRRAGEQLIVYCDPTQVVPLFASIIENSMKFHRGTQPVIYVEATPENGGVMISIRDNGIGIEPVNQKNVFKLFYRENSPSEFEGMGLGLSISKRIVTRHEGRIWLESEPGIGTKIFFTLPGKPGCDDANI